MSHCCTLWVFHYLIFLFFPLFKFVRYQSSNIISQKEISQIIQEAAEANLAELPEATSCALRLFLCQVREQWLLGKMGRESLGVCFSLWRSHCSVWRWGGAYERTSQTVFSCSGNNFFSWPFRFRAVITRWGQSSQGSFRPCWIASWDRVPPV